MKRCRLKTDQRYFVFLKKGIFITPGARCCEEHMDNKQLTYDALQRITGSISSSETWNSKEINQCFFRLRSAINSLRVFDFDDPCYMHDYDYLTMTGLSKGKNVILSF